MQILGILGEDIPIWDMLAQNSTTELRRVPSVQEADFIYINLPLVQRYEYAAKALLAKKHVLCPAPSALSTEAFWSLLMLCNKQNRVFFEFQPLQWTGLYQTLAPKIKSLGQVLSFDITMSVPSALSLGQGGGALINAALPALYLICELIGEPNFVSARAKMIEGMDASLSLTLGAGSARGSLNASIGEGANCMNLLCEKGGLSIDGPLLGDCRLFSPAEGKEIFCPQIQNPYALAVDEFLGHVQRHSPLLLGERLRASRRVYRLINDIKKQIHLVHPTEKPYRVEL